MKRNKNDILEIAIKTTATSLNIPQETVDKIAQFQWKTIKAATLEGSILEISGMGRFLVRANILEKKKKEFKAYLRKAEEKMALLTKEDEDWYKLYTTIKNLKKDIEFLNKK